MTRRAMVIRLNQLDGHLRSVLNLPRSAKATTLEQAIANSAATTEEVLFGDDGEGIALMPAVAQRLLMASLQAQVEARLVSGDDSGATARSVIDSIRRLKAASSVQALERQRDLRDARGRRDLQRGERAPRVVNLASQEYFKAVDRKALRPRVVECVFEDWKGGSWKIISFHAKRARGLMARHAIQQRARKPEDLRGFDAEGWAHDAAASSTDRMVFRRRLK